MELLDQFVVALGLSLLRHADGLQYLPPIDRQCMELYLATVPSSRQCPQFWAPEEVVDYFFLTQMASLLPLLLLQRSKSLCRFLPPFPRFPIPQLELLRGTMLGHTIQSHFQVLDHLKSYCQFFSKSFASQIPAFICGEPLA